MEHAWYAVRVRSNHESTAAEYLKSIGNEVFNPTYRDSRRWSDRVKQVDVPLFSGYIFCNMDINRRLPVLQAPGVINIVAFGKQFMPISVQEIGAVRKTVESPLFARRCPYLTTGERVRVQCGPLAGVEGILVERRNDTRLVVSVDILQRSISAEVNIEWVRPVQTNFVSALAAARGLAVGV